MSEHKPIDMRAKVSDETIRGVGPTVTVGETYAGPPKTLLQDYAELFKLRVTSLVVLTSWTGVYMACAKTGTFSVGIFLKTMAGVWLVSAGAAAMNQVIEKDVDARMARTKDRPLPTKRMSMAHASAAAILVTLAGSGILAFATNWITGLLALSTMLVYCYIYTPLKKVTPHSTFVGAFPGSMAPVIGWMAVTGRFDLEALALFAILFFWQFPHFLAIAWLYRDDYQRGGVRMLPVVDPDGKLTLLNILLYGAALVPISLAPYFLGMSGKIYLGGAVVLGLAYLGFGIRLAALKLPPSAAMSKKPARHLLQASVVYLPLVLILLAVDQTLGK